MRLGLLASSVLILATASANAGSGPSSIQAQGGAGVWSKAASLATGREEHTATLLQSGKVLIAGGTDGRGNTLYSAELYDPATNRWTSAGSMATAHVGHTATLLPTGKVLVAGGFIWQQSGPLAAAELYDPATNSWSAAAPMIKSRTRHAAVLLPDGRLLVVGGQGLTLRDGGFFPDGPTGAEIYDPIADHWSETAAMGVYRVGHTATPLLDGRVLVAGGGDEAGGMLNSTEIYDPTRDRWISAAPMAVARSGHAATPMANGDVLVTGSLGGEENKFSNALLTSAEIYNPRTNVWITAASMSEVHVEGTATLLRNGRVMVVGAPGQSRPELYDPAQNGWSRTGPLVYRYQHTATRLPNGNVLVVGGYGIESLDSAIIYDPLGVAPVPARPVDPRIVVALLFVALLVLASIGWSIPALRQRVKRWRTQGERDEWIT
jgi:N-acetylneuraminic acid mutarotase